MIKNIHTAHIVTGSHEQIMIGSYDRRAVIREAKKLREKYHRTVKFQTIQEMPLECARINSVEF
jgi:hypothetical protein